MNKIILSTILFFALGLNAAGAEELPYDYTDTTSIPIKLTPVDYISTRQDLLDGMDIEFKAVEDVLYNNRILVKKGQIINAKLETKITSGMNGFPAELIIDDFEIPGVKSSQLISNYVRRGQNRCYIVFPLKWALTFLPPTGSLTNFIKGGHAVLRPGRVITIYYYPNWK